MTLSHWLKVLTAEAAGVGSCRRVCLIHLRSETNVAQPQAQDADWDDDSFLRLYLTTLAGTVIQMQVPVSIHHTWEMGRGWGLQYLVSKRERGPARVPRLLGEDLWWSVDPFDREP